MWSYIKEVIPSNASHTSYFDKIVLLNNDIIENDEKIANEFNTYFINIVHKLFQSNKNIYHSVQCLLPLTHVSFNFQEINVSNVQNILNDIRDKATGLYGIHFKFINLNQHFFAHLFCKFFNLMINDSIFPNVLKFSTVIPLHKSGVKTNICNYRPINQLNNVSKIFERLLFTQLYNHFEDNNLFYNFQFGFRKHRNALNLKFLLINDIKSNEVDKRFSCFVFIDT